MYQIPLRSVANQEIAFNLDGAYWQLQIHQSISFMVADIIRNGVQIVTGVRCFGGSPLMPYAYMYMPDFGNFVFDSDGDWTQFGAGCNLYYLVSAEFQDYLASLETGLYVAT